MDSLNREAFLRIINLVSPALSSQDFIPILKNICFRKGRAVAFNDRAAIGVKLPAAMADLSITLPGAMLKSAVGSFNAESVSVTIGEGSEALITSGRSKIKLATMPAGDFPFKMPDSGTVFKFTEPMLKAVQACLPSIGNDPTRPATMGVTIDVEDGQAVFYSTDNATISRYKTKSKVKLPGDTPVILPAFFCEQLVALSRAYPQADWEIDLAPGVVVGMLFEGDENVAFTLHREQVDPDPLDFPAVINRHCKLATLPDLLEEIPAALDAAMGRAILVQSQEPDKATKITVTETAIKLLSSGPVGEAQDSVSFDGAGDSPPEPFFVDPGLFSRGLKGVSHIAFFPKVVVMGNEDGSFIHLVSHCVG